jgi:hypothetical protein
MKLSKVLKLAKSGQAIKFSIRNKPRYQIIFKEKYILISFDMYGQRTEAPLSKKIHIVKTFLKINSKAKSILKIKGKYSKPVYNYDIKIFKRPIIKNEGAIPINKELEKYFKNNSFRYQAELNVYGAGISSIADYVSVQKEELITYEVKSDVDSFVRLEKQLKDYKTYSDRVYIVLHEKKSKNFKVPKDVGLLIYSENGLKLIKKAPKLKTDNLLCLLNYNEKMSVLKAFKGYTKIKNRNKFFKIFTKKDLRMICLDVLSDRFKNRERKNYTHGKISIDISKYQQKVSKLVNK